MNAKLPPGPANLNACIGLTWRHYWRLRTNPVGFATGLARKYGDLTFFRVFGHRAFLVNHPNLIRQVLVSEADNFPRFDRVRKHLRQATGDGLLVTEGEEWRRQRLSSQKIFRSNRIDVFGRLATEYTNSMLSQWQSRPHVQIEHEMTLLTQAIMGHGFFGLDLRPGDKIAEAVRDYSDIFHHESRALFNVPDWLPTTSKGKKRESIRMLRESLADVVRERQTSGARRDDFLDMLLYGGEPRSSKAVGRRPVEGVVNQLLTMYVAGFHTTSVALAWLFLAVTRHPHVQQRLRQEIREVCGTESPTMRRLERLKYAQMVIKESLRLYPAAWELFARRSIRDCEMGGYRVPAGSLVFIMPIVTHRDPRFFQDPESFDPLRFSPERERRIPPFAFLPFGAGPRHCIGKNLALTQMCQILAAVLQRFELTLDESITRQVQVNARVSLRPAHDIKIMLKQVDIGPASSNRMAHSAKK